MKPRKRRPWKSEEVHALRQSARRKTGVRRIAKRLQRTENAIRQKAFFLGLSLETRLGMLV